MASALANTRTADSDGVPPATATPRGSPRKSGSNPFVSSPMTRKTGVSATPMPARWRDSTHVAHASSRSG